MCKVIQTAVNPSVNKYCDDWNYYVQMWMIYATSNQRFFAANYVVVVYCTQSGIFK